MQECYSFYVIWTRDMIFPVFSITVKPEYFSWVSVATVRPCLTLVFCENVDAKQDNTKAQLCPPSQLFNGILGGDVG